MNIGQLWDQLVDCICRPPRDRYTLQDLIGGERHAFSIGAYQGIREDLELVNARGQKLQCSHFKPAHLRQKGSGLSDGDWVTLGAREVDDLEIVVNHLRNEGLTSTIGLWGRSMGAVTALMYCKRDPSMAGVVLDSPFSRLNDLMLELVQEQQIPIPRPFVRVALAAMRRSVRKRAGFDIYQVAPLQSVDEAFVPVLFGHATGDTFVKKEHSEKLHEKYAGDKNIITLSGLSLAENANESRVRGQTNVPWDPRWTGHTPTATDFDDMLWASSANGRENETSSGDSYTPVGEDPGDNNLENMHYEGGDSRWYGMLPESTIAEESMLQAALEASLQDSKQSSRKDTLPGVIAVEARPGVLASESGTEAESDMHEADSLNANLGGSDAFFTQEQK